MTSVAIGNNVTIIDDNAFMYCSNLVLDYLPNSLTYIGNSPFWGCDVLDIDTLFFNDSLKHIGDYAFRNFNSLKYVYMPFSLDSIDRNPFVGCDSLNTVLWNLPCDVFSVTNLFVGCNNIRNFIFGDSVRFVPNNFIFFI